MDIHLDGVDVGAICRADLFGDSLLVMSFLEQVKDFGANHVETENLAPFDIQKDSTVRGLCSSNRVGDRKQGMVYPSRVYRNP